MLYLVDEKKQHVIANKFQAYLEAFAVFSLMCFVKPMVLQTGLLEKGCLVEYELISFFHISPVGLFVLL